MTSSLSRPTLALCIPAYNAGTFLPRLLSSASKQTIPFDEVLVYDDCSTDDTAEVARNLGATVVQGDRNRGCSIGKNRLLTLTRSTWVHFHDADDDLTPDFTAVAHRWMASAQPPEVVLFEYENRRMSDGTLVATKQYDGEALRQRPAVYAVRQQITNFGLYKVDALRRVGGFDEDPAVLYNEDCRFHQRLAMAGLRFDVENERVVINLERSGSMSSASRGRCALSRLAVLTKAAHEGDPSLRTEIGMEAWLNARHLGFYGHFTAMAEAIDLAVAMGVASPEEEEKWLLRILARVAPVSTFRARAAFVRWRDWVRAQMPSALMHKL